MRSIGFGLERLGLLAVARPRLALALTVVLIALSAYGATQLRFVDASRAVFRGDTPAWQAYRDLSERHGDLARNAVLVVAGDLSEPAAVAALRRLHDRLAQTDALAGVVSIFSLHRLAEGLERAAVPGAAPSGDAGDGPAEPRDPAALAAHPLNQGQFLAADRRHAALLLDPARPIDDVAALRSFERALQPALAELPPQLTAQLTGVPILRTRVLESLVAEQPWLLAGGFAIGFLLGWLLLGRLADAAVIAVVPAVAVAGAYGLIGLAGLEMTVLLNNLPLLILALGFADHMHLVYDARRRLAAAGGDFAALAGTIRHVGPACALSALTTMLAFLSFELAESAAIREFGRIGAASVAGVFLACMLVHPAAVWLALRLGWRPRPAARGSTARGFERLGAGLGRQLLRRRAVVAGVGLLAVAAAGWGTWQVRPSHSLFEQLPAHAPAYQAAQAVERHLGGLHAVQLPLPLELSAAGDPVAALADLRRVQAEVQAAFPDRPVLSPAAVVAWLDGAGYAVGPDTLRTLLEAAPAALHGAVLARDGAQPALTLRVSDAIGAAAAADRLERVAGDALGADLSGEASGFAVLAERSAPDVIRRLQLGLLAAAAGAALLMGLAFRSARVAAIALWPNLLPVLAVGAGAAALGLGLQISSALAMTVALGIAVDDTVHVANAYAAQRRRRGPATAVRAALAETAPVLVMTSLVLTLGLGPALFSWSPAVATFAAFAVATIALALLADLLLLPALLPAWRGPPRARGHRGPGGSVGPRSRAGGRSDSPRSRRSAGSS